MATITTPGNLRHGWSFLADGPKAHYYVEIGGRLESLCEEKHLKIDTELLPTTVLLACDCLPCAKALGQFLAQVRLAPRA